MLEYMPQEELTKEGSLTCNKAAMSDGVFECLCYSLA